MQGWVGNETPNRKLELDDDEPMLLWAYMAGAKAKGRYTFDVPVSEKQSPRQAQIEVKSEEVRLAGRGPAKQPLSLYVVYAKEVNSPAGVKPIEWMLLTDLPVQSFDQAQTIIDWYRCRWEIEVYFRVLKGGCAAEANRLQTEGRMFNCIAVYMIIAWRLQFITKQARSTPDACCTEVFSAKEWAVIWVMSNGGKPPAKAPSLREITRQLAGLGGFLGRKSDGEPGVKTVWQGYQKLLCYIEALEQFGALNDG